MRVVIINILLFYGVAVYSQDKIYLLDGSSRSGKIIEVSPENITVQADEIEVIPRRLVLLLEFKNGSVDVINKPLRPAIYNSRSAEPAAKMQNTKNEILNNNMISLNTLALCNSDISGFYEHLTNGKQIGLGVMAAYNFNLYAGFQNYYIDVLTNAKKKYDLGLFANFYTRRLQKGTALHFGILFKYMSFIYSKAVEEKVVSGGSISTNIKYSPASGSQLATIFTFGTHTKIAKNIFVKTLFGVGGFNLRGDYQQQYNYYLNKRTNQGKTTTYDRTFLLKMYMGINVGYNF